MIQYEVDTNGDPIYIHDSKENEMVDIVAGIRVSQLKAEILSLRVKNGWF